MERKITDGLWIGDMKDVPYRPMFEVVLTVNEKPGKVDDKIKHRHIAMVDNDDPQLDELSEAVAWVRDQWEEGREVLVRSKHGVNRPAYVVIATFMDMGAEFDDAVESVMRRVESPLQNDVFLDQLAAW